MASSSLTDNRLLMPLLLENLQDYAIFTLDTNGTILSWAPGVAMLLGYQEAEFIGQSGELIFTPEDRRNNAAEDEMQQAREEGRAEDSRWHLRKDGTRFWANGQMVALRNEAGELQGFAKILRDDTSRKQLEDKLQEASSRHQSALDAGSIGTWQWDIENDRVFADVNLARFFGVSAEDANGGPIEHYTRVIHREDEERVVVGINESIENDTAFFAQYYRLMQQDGSVLWVEARGRIKKDAQERPIRLDGVILDISERKRIEAALSESQERYRTLFTSIDVGFCVIEMVFDDANRPIDYLFLEVNPAFEAQTGLANAVGKSALELVPDLDHFWFEMYGKIALTGEPVRFENPAPAMNRWFEVYALRVGGSESRKVALLFSDITTRKNMEEALRQGEERYRTLFESIDTGFCVIKMLFDDTGQPIDYRFLETNPAFEKESGLFDVRGKRMLELSPTHEKHWFEIYGRVALTGESMRFENQAEALGRYYDVYALRIGNPEEHKVGVLFNDITERKNSEYALRQAHEKSEETNRLKDEFLATLSHELRSPLNAILGWANLLRTNQLDAETAQSGLETIERNARSQAQLIEDLLDVSRILTGKLRLDLRPTEAGHMLEDAVLNVAPTADAKSIQLHIDIDHASGLISGDAQRLSQVFWNLLTNAIKFTPKEGHIWVSMRRADSQVQVQISDTGRGISAEFLPHVFDRFRQADSSSTRSAGGLGIGLGLVKYLVEAHGGTVSASSQGEGKGSTFTLRFPLQSVRPDPEPEVQAASSPRHEDEHLPAANSSPLLLQGVKILVVDDENDAREIVAFTLQQRGAIIETANSAQVALAKIAAARQSQHPFDALVSDIGMPLEDGYSLIQRIRASEKKQDKALPAVALTAYASPKDRTKALMAGFHHHLSKPVDANELTAVVASLLGRIAQIAQ